MLEPICCGKVTTRLSARRFDIFLDAHEILDAGRAGLRFQQSPTAVVRTLKVCFVNYIHQAPDPKSGVEMSLSRPSMVFKERDPRQKDKISNSSTPRVVGGDEFVSRNS